jgi:hypothetical protein
MPGELSTATRGGYMGKTVTETPWDGLLVTIKIILYLWLITILIHFVWQLSEVLQ